MVVYRRRKDKLARELKKRMKIHKEDPWVLSAVILIEKENWKIESLEKFWYFSAENKNLVSKMWTFYNLSAYLPYTK